MDSYKTYWNKFLINEVLEGKERDFPKDAEKYVKGNILDLGSGNGYAIPHLAQKGCKVFCADFCEASFHRTSLLCDCSIRLDMSNPIDWEQLPNNFFDFVYANLSLGYFSSQLTTMIMREINRILKIGGVLFARIVTSQEIPEFKLRLEDNFYLDIKNQYKFRVFTHDDIEFYFELAGEILSIENFQMKDSIIKETAQVVCERKN